MDDSTIIKVSIASGNKKVEVSQVIPPTALSQTKMELNIYLHQQYNQLINLLLDPKG